MRTFFVALTMAIMAILVVWFGFAFAEIWTESTWAGKIADSLLMTALLLASVGVCSGLLLDIARTFKQS